METPSNDDSKQLLFRFTYEISPVYILMEKEVTKRMIELIGWEDGDYIFAPGQLKTVCTLKTKLTKTFFNDRAEN